MEKKILVQNRKVRHNYHIEELFEAGLALQGSEVKSLRAGRGSLVDAYAIEKNGEIFLQNAHIDEYGKANNFKHDPRRLRKLLLNKKEINKLLGAVKKKGKTIAVLSLYLNKRNLVKAEIALASGKKMHDKRATIKERDWQREKERVLKQ
jgi:SsrA-binding protein